MMHLLSRGFARTLSRMLPMPLQLFCCRFKFVCSLADVRNAL